MWLNHKIIPLCIVSIELILKLYIQDRPVTSNVVMYVTQVPELISTCGSDHSGVLPAEITGVTPE